MERTVLQYAPSYWDTSYVDVKKQVNVGSYSEEYMKIKNEVVQATGICSLHINFIQRYQNIHDYGQVIIREQLMAVANEHQKYYRVRRYITIRRPYLLCALEYNLDYRRCGKANLVFKKRINLGFDEMILVVQVITTTPDADSISPTNSSDYFIDYIVDVQN